MSKSRLEKFLYALYSLESSDLPKPLSRIEELYNCLVTGEEVPTFEPLSRVEKYLMAILGTYDVELLPNPISRVEVLLYKLATGDDNLDDIEPFLSRHEELLAEIIRNGDISFDDYEYMGYSFVASQYTLENTAEQPMKSAVLKGQTLVNVEDYIPSDDSWSAVKDGDYLILTASGSWNNAFTANTTKVKPSTKYMIIVDVAENTIKSSGKFALKLCSNRSGNQDSVWPYSGNDTPIVPLGFTGQLRFILTTLDDTKSKRFLQRAFLDSAATSGHIKYRYMIIEYQDGMENWDIPYFEGMKSVENPVVTTRNIQLEEGSVATEYEPFKSNILTVNEDVTLRGVGDVKDELDLVTGEVTTRTREVVYNSTDITIGKYSGKENTFNLFFNDKSKNTHSIMVDKIPFVAGWTSFLNNLDLSCSSLSSGYIYVTIPNVNTAEEAKTYLSNLNPTFLYILTEESIKTVDISTVDQDGNDISKLNTFEDLTYVTIESEGVIPEVSLEVATKNIEDVETIGMMSLRMNNILSTQSDLQETANTQSENVDATMIATTEIYEGLL